MSDLTTIDRVKRYLEERPSDSTLDARLTELIKTASAWFQAPGQAGRSIIAPAASATESYDGDGSRRLTLLRAPVVSVASVKVDGETVDARSTATGTGYVVEKEEGRIALVGSRFTCGFSNVEVTYTAGYAAVPDDVAEAVAAYTVILYKDPKRVGLSSMSVSGESASFDGNAGVLAFINSVVDSYRRITVG